jgi:hypothetical protein
MSKFNNNRGCLVPRSDKNDEIIPARTISAKNENHRLTTMMQQNCDRLLISLHLLTLITYRAWQTFGVIQKVSVGACLEDLLVLGVEEVQFRCT